MKAICASVPLCAVSSLLAAPAEDLAGWVTTAGVPIPGVREQAIGFEIASPGESLRFITAKTLTDGDTRNVVAMRKLSTTEVLFTFDASVPDSVSVGDALKNPGWQPSERSRFAPCHEV
ncbi:hypothetical protein OKA05_17905 [Luteolibacter arcticus]|uniref:GLAA-B beta-barrel domain-containing protein n=1 Tax=Luteolibacter arcticus TaxID=1581411 RepID=A0ABT3GLU9_9BACT|nr:hypothetical protein [Luteolibacter arcticus]MCW1924446.1 hypothetical protein [Luteolibacter arcticus]